MIAEHLIHSLSMSNTIVPNDRLIVGGQPNEHDFEVLAAMGVTQIVNLRPLTESIPFDEAALARKWQLQYHVIDVTTIETCTIDKAKQLKEVLGKGEPTLVHCAGGNRVGALIALMAFWLDDCSAADAFNLGVACGLTKYTEEVKQVLGV